MTTGSKRAFDFVACLIALSLCWKGVSWTLGAGQYLWMDEIGNLTRYLNGVHLAEINLLPATIYNDRPIGFIFERLLYSFYGFDYGSQVPWLLGTHFINIFLAAVLFRKLGVDTAVTAGALAAFGTLITTMQTATYLGAVFDVLSLTFFLAGALLIMEDRRICWAGSFICFVMALRTKEIAFADLPLFGLLLVTPTWDFKRLIRMSPHFALGVAMLLVYVAMFHASGTAFSEGNPYTPVFSSRVIAESLLYYTGLIFSHEPTGDSTFNALTIVAASLGAVYAVIRRNIVVLTGLLGYVFFLFPVLLLPRQRAPFYVYAAQLLLLLALAGIADQAIRSIPARNRDFVRYATVAIVFLSCFALLRGTYFQDRVNFLRTVRTISARSGEGALAIPPVTGPIGVVVEAASTPWLFVPGPCSFLQVAWRNAAVTCSISTAGEKAPAFDRKGLRIIYDASGAVRVADQHP